MSNPLKKRTSKAKTAAVQAEPTLDAEVLSISPGCSDAMEQAHEIVTDAMEQAREIDNFDEIVMDIDRRLGYKPTPRDELLEVRLQLVSSKLELLTNRFDAHEKSLKDAVIKILDEHVEKKFKEEREEQESSSREDTSILSDRAEINLRGIYHSEDHGVRVELDWNDEFIKYLRTRGVTGADDEQVVKHWLAFMLRDVEQSIDGKKKADESEFI